MVLTELRRRWDDVIHEQKDVSMHCTEYSEIKDEMIGKEVIDLCSKNQTIASELHDGEEIRKLKVRTNEKQNNPNFGEQK